MAWTLAIHFKTWADIQAARSLLPLVVRRLIRDSVSISSTVNLPAGEQVSRPGLDGTVKTETEGPFVPTGNSVWEMGVNRNHTSKANTDFTKRTDDTPVEQQRETTFVFVTPREWQNKDEWAADKMVDGGNEWKEIRVFDANDLEHWIELCPAVDAWFSTVTSRRPAGLLDLERRWAALQNIAEHQLLPAVFLASRDQTIATLTNWLQSDASSLLLQSQSVVDCLDFLSAFQAQADPDDGRLQRQFVFTSVDAWRALSVNHEPLVMVAGNDLPLTAEDMSEAVVSGHHVLILGGETVPGAASVSLPRQESGAVATALEASGFSRPDARTKATECCGSSAVLKRLLTTHPQREFPAWCSDEHRPSLAAFALIGG